MRDFLVLYLVGKRDNVLSATKAERSYVPISVFNVFLDWLFVGPLKMGGKGAAWATTIAQVVLGAWEGVRGLEG